MKTLTNHELRELLNKNWMTHDGMWFRHCLEAVGIEQTNRINRAAIRSLAPLEARRMLEALGLERPEDFSGLKAVTVGFFGLVGADFMRIRYDFPREGVIRFTWGQGQCFAYEGMKRLGVADRYECGIFERVGGWFASLGLAFTLYPETQGCLMHEQGRCVRELRFSF